MSVHPDLTAIRAVDACGGTYSAAELSSRFAEGHSAALCEAMAAVVSADAITAELLDALEDALDFVTQYEDVVDGDYGAPAPNAAMTLAQMMRAAIAKASEVSA